LKEELRKNIVITGASSGIGKAIAEALIKDGHNLIICARTIDSLKIISDDNKIALYKKVDVGVKQEVIDFASFVDNHFGHVDALICCAGKFGAIGKFWEVNDDDWWDTLQTNLFGTFLTIKYFTPLLKRAKAASVITFSGGGAFNSFPKYSAYATSKAAVVRLTETMAEEFKPLGISINALAPGFVNTPIHLATIEAGPEVAGEDFYNYIKKKMEEGAVPILVPVNCVRFLISDAAKGLTGKTISANFDPWDSESFFSEIPNISKSDLYTMRRINKENIPNDKKWAGFD
jgi:NAD(P)-dependent dehydrogenase (short-subunit alcohol dehydrogenase family)